ncbi:hypothetical protein [Pseudobacteriovorax antillogorgiicola]|uniref:MetA-pathway of phenol degradation n=1 Tax=Pseudobacteriovorax antillogorgiicola TaxID=1513793 RepID=A0A1Y6BGZ0_9BACT|nr:hypothetical protein [Pseudobacteriovorax antillogorgiicola]TCS57322.1 hypothetical protein EDD56_10362 [Pseudobacteriovorax antillogorgiicola]SMF02549.1 hypothetical protein SAMN06296036_103271 [Pseudobacteriovorax antillogorgiicola]
MITRLKLLILLLVLSFSGEPTTALAQSDFDADTVDEDEEEVKVKKKKRKKRKKRRKRKKRYKPSYYSSLGLGKTLPAGFYRFRGVTKISQGSTGYDSSGKSVDQGFDLSVLSHGLVTEYGMSENLSFQLLIPYISKNSLGFNPNKFKQSAAFSELESQYQRLLAGTMIQQGLCDSAEECLSTPLDNNLTLPLPTGETTTLPAGVVPAQAIPNLISDGAKPADGATGIGDVDFGILYTVLSGEKYNFSIGTGVRLPVGDFESVPAAQRPTGEGLMQGAIRLNYDYHPVPALWLAVQNQSEFTLLDGRRKKSSLLDPNQLNEGDPTSDIAIAAGSDGSPNDQTVTKKGITNVGMFRADLGLSNLGLFFQPIAVETSINYKFGADTYYGDQVEVPGPEYLTFGYGFKYDGLGLKRPFPGYFKLNREIFISGKNVPLAPNSVTIEFALYESF